jgi:hypothetical protein
MEIGDNHGFPKIVDNFGANGKLSKFLGGDGKIYNDLKIDGSYRGASGYFHYIWSERGELNHRLFKETK